MLSLIHIFKEKQLPDLDDEFASEVSDFDTMAEYREDVQKKLTSKKEEEAKIAKEEAVLDAVIADAQMEIPDAMLETQQRQLLENFAQRIQAQGITLEQYMQFTGLTAQTMMEQLKPEALKRICLLYTSRVRKPLRKAQKPQQKIRRPRMARWYVWHP